MANWINFNGKLVEDNVPVLGIQSRAFRYGDGLFETLKYSRGSLLHAERHMARLFAGMQAMRFEIPPLFTPAFLEAEADRLIRRNKPGNGARVRITVFRGMGGLFDPEDLKPRFAIEVQPLAVQYFQLNENGLVCGIYPEARKAIDRFSNLKTAQYLPYTQAALYAGEQKWNDALVLNAAGRICDSTMANLFLIKAGRLLTPALAEGPVAGVMRAVLQEAVAGTGLAIEETTIEEGDLQEADGLFLTNAVRGIRWVKQCGNTEYHFATCAAIYQQLAQTIYA